MSATTDRVTPVLDVGGTHVTAALVDLGFGRVVPGTTRRSSLDGAAPAHVLLDVIVRCGRDLAAPAETAWGVAVPGPFDYAEGIARFEGVGKFDALNGVDIGAVLRRELPGVPSTVVFVNDAIAFSIGEWAFGAGEGHDRMVGITLGTGVGSGFLDDGVPVASGPQVPPDGEVYQLRIDGRPLEDTVSRRALLREYARLRPDSPCTDVRDIADRAYAGDPAADEVLRTAFTRLGLALAPWLSRFGATALVVGGSMSRSWDRVHPSLTAGIQASPDHGPDLHVVPARDSEMSALLGAAWRAVRGGTARAGECIPPEAR
ncbi:MAG: ROK family protein [Lapillicoccus sp.]